jgi:hypothetical protein
VRGSKAKLGRYPPDLKRHIRRHVTALLAEGRLHLVAAAPRFKRRVYVVENAQTVRNRAWWDDAVASIVPKDGGSGAITAAE